MDIPRREPSTQGVAPAGLLALLDAFDADPRIDPHALIVQRHGVRILDAAWAPHTTDRARLVYSLSKSFTSTALGLQIGEGRLGLDDLVADHLPVETAGADERTRSLRVRHLASLATGHDRETLPDAVAADPDDLVRGFFSLTPAHEPGTRFAYNQPPVAALAAILQRLAGERLVDYLRPRLAPLGITDLRWRRLRTGLDPGYTGAYTSLDSVARLGQLHLDGGRWQGRQVLPEGWVAQASRPQVANPGEPHPDWQQGYGFGLWIARHGYRGDGAFGQLMVVLPEHDAVVAMFADTAEMQVQLDHLWTHLLPAIGPEPLVPSSTDQALAERIAGLAVPTARQRTADAEPRSLDGTFLPVPFGPTSHRTITSVDGAGDHVVIHEERGSMRVPLRSDWTEVPGFPVATSAATDPAGRVVVHLAFLDTPHRLEVVIDPTAATVDARWPAVPLFGGGLAPPLTTMAAPDR